MTKNDIKILLAMLGTVYSKNLLPAPDSMTINTWEALLRDMDFERIKAAALQWSSTEKYPPTISDLRGIVTDNQYGTADSAQTAWGNLQKAVLRFGYTNEEDALDALDGTTKKIVAEFGWKYFCQMPIEKESTYYAQFRNAYEVECKRQKGKKQVPLFIQAQVEKTREPVSKQITSKSNFKEREYSPEYLDALQSKMLIETERLAEESETKIVPDSEKYIEHKEQGKE